MQYKKIPILITLSLLMTNTSNIMAQDDEVELSTLNVVAEDEANTFTEMTSEETKSYRIKKSRASTKLNLDVKETPQSVSVVTRQLMDDFNVVSVNEALSLVTGVNVESVETDRTYYTSRGFDITNFQLDGLNTPIAATFGNVQGDLDAVLYDRIEVLRGANGLLTGIGNPSATINFIRKRPTTEFQAKVGGLVGSWDRQRITGDVSGSLNADSSLRGRVIAAYEDKDSYLDRYGKRRKVLSGIADFAITDNTVITVGHTYHSDRANSPMWGSLELNYSDGTQTDFDVSASNAAEWAYWERETNNTFAEIKTEFDNGWQALATVSYNRLDNESQLFYTFGALDRATGNGMIAYPSDYRAKIRQSIADVYASGPFSLAGREHEVVVGLQAADSNLEHRSIHGNTAFLPIDFATYLGGTYPKSSFNLADGAIDGGGGELDEQFNSLYGSTKLNVTDDLKMIVGTRYTSYEMEGVSYGTVSDIDKSKWVPYLGTVYSINDRLNVYASMTDVFQPQEETDVTGSTLEPIEGRTYEAGLKYGFNQDRVLVTASVFRTEQDNLAVATGGLVIGTLATPAYDTEDGVTSKGFEVDVMGEVLPGWNVMGGYTYVDIEDKDGERVNTHTPKQTFKVATTYQVKAVPGLKVGGNVSWRDRTYGELAEQNSYAIWNALASYEVTPKLTANLNIYNLFDKEYVTSLYWAGLFGQGFKGSPRSAALSLTYQF